MEACLQIDPQLTNPRIVVPALIWAQGIQSAAGSDQPAPFLKQAIEHVRQQEDPWPAGLKQAVRKMLRYGRYKPNGRGKPASEFLLQAARANQFPSLTTAVDINNAISLQSGLPGSIFDADRSGTNLLLRRGQVDERYIFNQAGQSIELQDLLLICKKSHDEWVPCGNPVKDSLATKLDPSTKRIVAVLYSPSDWAPDWLEQWTLRFVALLETVCLAETVGWTIYNTTRE